MSDDSLGGDNMTQGAQRFLANYDGDIPRAAIVTMAKHIQQQYGSVKCHRLHVVKAIKGLNGGKP